MGFLTGLSARAWASIGLAALVAVLAWRGYVAVFDRGVDHCEARHGKVMAEAIQRAQAEARAIALQDAEVIYSGLAERERIRTVYRVREKEVEKHVPIDCNQCRLSPPGVGLLNDALSDRQLDTPDTRSQPPVGATPQPPGGDRNIGGNGGLIDNRQWKVL